MATLLKRAKNFSTTARDGAKPKGLARPSKGRTPSRRSNRLEHPSISVVIPTFNRAAMLSQTLESFATQSISKHRYELVVVDDGSKDVTAEVCKDFAERIQLSYRYIDNSGISAAKNAGIRASRGRILLFADDDDIADPYLLEEHLKAHKRHPQENVAVLGYTTWAPTLSITPLMRYVTEIGRFLFAYGDLRDDQMLDFTYFWGGRASCKRSFLDKRGIFNPSFRFGSEDMELGYRLSKFGFRVVFHRAAVSYVARPPTLEEFCDRCERQGESLFLFSRLHDDPVVQQYCKLADPFIDNRAVTVDAEKKWADVAALFQQKLDQTGRIERLLAWGFEPETVPEVPKSKQLAQAEAYRRQMHELFTKSAQAEAYRLQMQDLFAKISELETKLPQREAAYQAELARLNNDMAQREAAYQAELARVNNDMAQREAVYQAELARLNTDMAEREAVYQAELARLNTDMAEREATYQAELVRLTADFENRFREISQLLHDKSISLAEHERCVIELRERLRRELWSVRKLSHLLDDAGSAAARLRSSRRWKLANPLIAIREKLSPGHVPVGYGHLEKIVSAYSKWRAGYPEIAKIEDEIRELRRPVATKEPERGVETCAQELQAPGPPAPALPVESICFPTHKEVEVSIIIPVFNQFQYTHACVASLQTIEEPVPLEVIIVDDCSTDETATLVPRMGGVVYLRNETNSGFIVSCNLGAKKARGKYLVFLNNDTIVKKDWLTTLLNTFAEEPKAGIVGSKLVYPDGRLQEAGGIIWRDASGWNYGKFDDPKKPEYNYLREVDYCSAAALMIPRLLFERVGGFDTKYAPAYYEDTDLAFKVRREGYKVLYQPLSEIIHYEGATGGTDVSSGTKKYQDINRLTFVENWASELAAKPVNGDLTFLQHAPTGGKNILVIDHHLPMPDRDSGSLRMFQILKLLHQLGHRVTFIPDNLADIPPYTGELQKRGIEVYYHPYIKSVREYLTADGAKFDVVLLSRCDFARKHIVDVRLHASQSRIIFDTVDLHFVREHREAQLTGDPEARRKALEKQRLEHELIEQSDETWVVSSLEQQLLQKKRPQASIQVVSNIVDVPGSSRPFALRRNWLFIGSFLHPPNIDAVLFFVEKVYPLVSQRLRDAKFYIVGDKAPPEVVALANESILVTGLQRDVRQFFDSVKLSVAPLRYGAGVKGKINQSMAFGVPVVATTLAAEGMELTDREDVLVADKPEDFARALIELYESEELWNRLSENGIKKTAALYSAEAARERLSYLFSDEHIGNSSRRKVRMPSYEEESTSYESYQASLGPSV
jgi:GT2 family glycosyltransferase/glycosyltransferase involved in cell wall biosynthesis